MLNCNALLLLSPSQTSFCNIWKEVNVIRIHISINLGICLSINISISNVVFLCLSLVAELRRQNLDFPEVSSGVLVQQVIPDTPAQKYVHAHVQKPKHIHMQHWSGTHQPDFKCLWLTKRFHNVIYYLWTAGKILRLIFDKWWPVGQSWVWHVHILHYNLALYCTSSTPIATHWLQFLSSVF